MNYNKELEKLFEEFTKLDDYVKANLQFHQYVSAVAKLKEVEYLQNIHNKLENEK